MTDIKINGHKLCPTAVQWMPRSVLDVQGDNRPIYSPIHTVQLRWEFVNYEQWASAQDVFNLVQSTGTAVATLPGFPTATGSAMAYQDYSGCVLGEPQVGQFFAESYPESMILVVTNIVTE